MRIDFPLSQRVTRPFAVGALNRIKLELRFAAGLLTTSRDDRGVSIEPLGNRPVRALAAEEMPLIFLARNDRRFMPSFFAHYRSMGVTRFICLDDRSTDGTREFLLDQEDADVYVSNVRYRDAERGKIWRECLLARYGLDRWYLVVDSDEYFVYESLGREPILPYVRRLEEHGIKRVPAPMLDLYPVGDLASATFAGKDDIAPWTVATHFDGDGYRAAVTSSGISIHGGARLRVFGARGELMKYPLMRWDRFSSLGRTIHRPLPAKYNFAPVLGALLHFKIFSDIREAAQEAVNEGQHYRGARTYQAVLDRLPDLGGVDLAYEKSVRYEGVDSLIAKGFLVPLP